VRGPSDDQTESSSQAESISTIFIVLRRQDCKSEENSVGIVPDYITLQLIARILRPVGRSSTSPDHCTVSVRFVALFAPVVWSNAVTTTV
jgi:hypothetical protein